MTDSQRLAKLSTQLNILADCHRRNLLFALRDVAPHESIHAHLDDETRGRDDHEYRVRMYHIHLPKLEDYDLINWRRENNTVQRGPEFEEIAPLLDSFESHRDELQLEIKD